MRRSGSIPEARSRSPNAHPQLLVTALGLGREDSLKLIRTLRAENPGCVSWCIRIRRNHFSPQRVNARGANGYVMKQAPREELAPRSGYCERRIYVSHRGCLECVQAITPVAPEKINIAAP